MKTINYGIDLGTTNSLIARFNQGKVEVFKNPVGFKETLPSCIAFREGRILIGDKAREWLLKDPLNVFAGFKRKMGTSETFYSPTRNSYHSPIQLSAMVLAELKNFIHNNEKPESVVITIPASFDTVQSNATKKAGYEAGFKEVVLLQEPIAASLAFFNSQGNSLPSMGKWLVYDLGGGTFDVALIGINESEMRVIDNQGDNYLGGLDFDHNLVMQVLLPKLVNASGNITLNEELNSRKGKYEKLYYVLLLKAEEAKKELSRSETTEVELSFDVSGQGEQDYYLSISRTELNACIEANIDRTLDMINTVLHRNQVLPADVNEIILIGGSTYIPYVRQRVFDATGIKVNCSADPSTAVAIGAAYYAGSKASRAPEEKIQTPVAEATNTTARAELGLQLAYKKTSRDEEEYVTGIVHNFRDGLQFRITRSDGGFDTGIKPLKPKFGEFVSLRPDCLNEFKLKIFDTNLAEVAHGASPIHITQGLFNLFGQPLPEDISIEVDDVDNNSTKCQPVFERNSILPLVKTIYREVSRTIKRGGDDKLIINVLEGNSKAHPNTNQGIGVIEINARDLQGDLIKGSDVEIKLEISESRDVSVKVNLLLFNQLFSNVFSPTEKYISLVKLREEIKELRNTVRNEVEKAAGDEDFERAADMQNLLEKIEKLFEEIYKLKDNDLSDMKYQVEEQKRRLAQEVYGSSNNPRLVKLKADYYSWRSNVQYWCDNLDDMPQVYKDEHEKLKAREAETFSGNSFFQFDGLYKSQMRLVYKMVMYTPTLTIHYFHQYASLPDTKYTNPAEARNVIAVGEKALERRNYEELRACLGNLLNLAKDTVVMEKIAGTGLG